ncbi:MAG: MoxR family ATPase [Eggerthellales bacterium]|nr:MoxR family ATPase [Eggerthellales bacterium]
MTSINEYLTSQNVSPSLIAAVQEFRQTYAVDPALAERVACPETPFYGTDTLEMALAAILQGQNLLLVGGKATGKNVLCETLSWVFGRPSFDISFHVNTDAASLIGTDTFRNNQVELRKGPIYQCAEWGGFGVLDEINMAKNDAVSVLHATLDHRRRIDVPGYSRIQLHPATRFIGTMNQGYAGTRELNEALVSRFLVVDMPPLDKPTLKMLLAKYFPDMREAALEQFAGLFMDLQRKADNGEISTKPLDLRGMIAGIRTIKSGLAPAKAIRLGVLNKTFDAFEKELLEDVAKTRIPESWTAEDVFEA